MVDREFVKTRVKTLIGLIIICSIFVYPQMARAYDTLSAHRAITNESAKVFNHYYPDKTLSLEQINLLIKGSADEDTPPRWLNHFYDPVHQIGFRGLLSSKNWAENTTAQAALINQAPLAEYFSAPTDYSWDRAIYDYVYGDKNRAMEALGHNLHLIQDATVPDHTRDDAHPIWSTYEHFAKQFEMANTDLVGKLIGQNQKPITSASLGEYFDYLANFSNSNFFSDDTVLEPNYPGPKITNEQEIILSDKNPHVFGQNSLVDNNKLVEIKRLKEKSTGQINIVYTINDYYNLIPTDYWLNLSPKAALASAGVIKLFFDEVEKEKQSKRLFEKNKSLAEKFLENLNGKLSGLLANVVFVDPGPVPPPVASSTAMALDAATSTPALPATPEPVDNRQAQIDALYQKLFKLKTELNQIIADKTGQTAGLLVATTTQALGHIISGGHSGSGNGGDLLPVIDEISNPATSSDQIIIDPPIITSPADFSASFATTSIIFVGTASSSLVIFNDFDRGQATTSEGGEWQITINDLPQGSSTIKFYARDSQGDVSLPTEVNLTVDSLPLAINFSIDNCLKSLTSGSCLLKPTSTLNFTWSPTKPGDYRYDLIKIAKDRWTGWLAPEMIASSINDTQALANLSFGSNDLLKEFKWQIIARSASSSETVASSSEIITTFHPRPIVINEIGWAGTAASSLDEWLELRNYLRDYPVDLSNYYLADIDKTWQINLTGQILPTNYYLVERGNDNVISNRQANLVDNFIADPNLKAFNPSSLGLKLWHRFVGGEELVDETSAWNKSNSGYGSLERNWEANLSADLATWEDNPGCNEGDGPCALDRNSTVTFGTPGVINQASIPRPW